jgi:hypothetical protein
MFEHLDDPQPSFPPAARAAVAARAARLRRQRAYGWTAGTAACAAVLVLVGYGLRSPGTPSPVTPAAPGPSAPASASPTPSGTPSPAAHPTTRPPRPRGTGAAHPPATSAPVAAGPTAYGPGSADCATPDALPDPGTAPFPGLSLTLEIPGTVTASHDADAEPPGQAVVRNAGSDTVTFAYASAWHGADPDRTYGPQTVARNGSGAASAYYDGAQTEWTTVTLAPGDTAAVPVTVRTTECATAPWTDPQTGQTEQWEQPLPAGTYQAGFALRWSVPGPPPSAGATPDSTGTWGAPPVTLRVR